MKSEICFSLSFFFVFLFWFVHSGLSTADLNLPSWLVLSMVGIFLIALPLALFFFLLGVKP